MDNHDQPVAFQIHPIGYVHKVEDGWQLLIEGPFRSGLRDLGQFGHVLVIWWADRNDSADKRKTTECHPPYATDHLTGVFACRSEYRPNPIAITVCKVRSVDVSEGIVGVPYMDAQAGTPIIDLKAYYPVCDRVREPKVPEWIAHWPEWVEDGGLLKF